VPRKPLRLPLREFIKYLDLVQDFDRRHNLLRQGEWMMKSFSFDDHTAEYEASPTLPNRGVLCWKALRG
jgi:hypothetical protein